MVPARMNAALNDPRMEPAVLAAYSSPTLPPVSAVERVTSRPASGKPYPISTVAGVRTTTVSTRNG
jgi:hypothetical protein